VNSFPFSSSLENKWSTKKRTDSVILHYLENGRISNSEGLMNLTLDWVILHTIMHHSSTSTYIPNVTKVKKTF